MSQILRTAPSTRLTSLFSLFPVKTLRETWNDIQGSKEAMAAVIAGNRDIPGYSAFLNKNINLCKQHIFAFTTNITAKGFSKLAFTGLDAITVTGAEANLSKLPFLFEIEVEVAIWSDPPERRILQYAVPLTIEFHTGYILVRLVKFERNIVVPNVGAENFAIRNIDHEGPRLAQIQKDVLDAGFTCTSSDLHKGTLRLWADDYMDASRLSYQTTESVDTTTMHDKRGIKQYNKAKYDAIQGATFGPCLFSTLVSEGGNSVDMTVNMAKGQIGFGTYAEREEDRNDILQQILRHNL